MMFWRVWETEKIKRTHSLIWPAIFMLPLIPAVMGSYQYWVNQEMLTNQWYDLWSQYILFGCYTFFPVLLGIACAWLWRLAHQAHNWNFMLTVPVPIACLYGAKLAMAAALLVLIQGWIGVLFFLAGKLCGLTAAFPMLSVLNWLACGWLGGMVICALQLLLSQIIDSFFIPVSIALLGGLLGLAATAEGWGVYFPYGLLAIGMGADAGSASRYGAIPFLFFASSYLLLFIILSLLYLGQTDQAAGEE